MNVKLDFYQEVEILSNCEFREYIGKKGIVMGISEEDGIIFSYAVTVIDEENGVCLKPDCLKPTGRRFKREDFY